MIFKTDFSISETRWRKNNSYHRKPKMACLEIQTYRAVSRMPCSRFQAYRDGLRIPHSVPIPILFTSQSLDQQNMVHVRYMLGTCWSNIYRASNTLRIEVSEDSRYMFAEKSMHFFFCIIWLVCISVSVSVRLLAHSSTDRGALECDAYVQNKTCPYPTIMAVFFRTMVLFSTKNVESVGV